MHSFHHTQPLWAKQLQGNWPKRRPPNLADPTWKSVFPAGPKERLSSQIPIMREKGAPHYRGKGSSYVRNLLSLTVSPRLAPPKGGGLGWGNSLIMESSRGGFYSSQNFLSRFSKLPKLTSSASIPGENSIRLAPTTGRGRRGRYSQIRLFLSPTIPAPKTPLLAPWISRDTGTRIFAFQRKDLPLTNGFFSLW